MKETSVEPFTAMFTSVSKFALVRATGVRPLKTVVIAELRSSLASLQAEEEVVAEPSTPSAVSHEARNGG